MHFLSQYLEFILHLNTHLIQLIHYFGPWIYVILFCIFFLETGVVLTPFLPGESLLFALGTIAATGAIKLHGLVLLLIIAVILGGFVNYFIGLTVGLKIFPPEKNSVFQTYIKKTQLFFDKHGTLTIVIARLIPIIRTYAPFVAGLARMDKWLFSIYNIIGGILWISAFLYISYFFGNIPIVKQHFSLVIIGIILFSVIPISVEVLRHFVKARKTP